MKRYSEKETLKVRQLRREKGYSFVQLSRITGIPQTTIRNWCYSDDVHTKWDTLRTTNERRRQEYKKSEMAALSKIESIGEPMAKIFAALIYWCEGAKYPATNRMALANSDVELQRTFIYLLRKGFSLDEARFSVHLQIHDTHNFGELREYWSDKLGIPTSQFLKPTVTSAKGKKHRKSYYGTCTLRYGDYGLQLKLIGLYEAIFNKFGFSE